MECVELINYEDFFVDAKSLFVWNKWKSVLMGKPYAYSPGATYAIYNLIPESSIDFKLSPVMLMKAKKNEVILMKFKHEIAASSPKN